MERERRDGKMASRHIMASPVQRIGLCTQLILITVAGCWRYHSSRNDPHSLTIVVKSLTHSFFFTFLRKKTATACAFAKQGRGLIKVNGQPIENIEPEQLRLKVYEPVLILGQDKFSNLDIRIRVKGG
jgi:hypothetical protein